MDCRFRPQCCHVGSYVKCPRSSPMHPLACDWYYCTQLIAKAKATYALCFSWAATSSNLGLRANMTSSIKKRKYRYKTYHYAATATAIDNRHKKYGEDQTCSSKDMIMETQTHTQTGTCSSQYSASYREQVIGLDDAISSAKITRC